MNPKPEVEPATIAEGTNATSSREQQELVHERVEGEINNLRREEYLLLLGHHEQNTHKVQGKPVKYLDLPPSVQAPEEIESPLVVIPGWGQSDISFAAPIEGYRRLGRRVLSMRHPYSGIASENNTVEDVHPVQLAKANAHIAMLEDAKKAALEKGDKDAKFDIVGYSEGAIIAAAVADLRPDLVKSLTLISPAGLVENDGVINIIGRIMAHQNVSKNSPSNDPSNTGLPSHIKEVAKKNRKEFFNKEGYIRSARYVWGLTRSKIEKLLGKAQSDNNIPVSIVLPKDDTVSPFANDVKKLSERTGVPVDRIRVVDGTHDLHMDAAGTWGRVTHEASLNQST